MTGGSGGSGWDKRWLTLPWKNRLLVILGDVRRRETSLRWHPPRWSPSFFCTGCFLFMCVCRRGGRGPLRPRLLFIIHRADLSVGDGAVRQGAAARRTSFQPEASEPDGVFLSLLLSVCFIFPCRLNPPSRLQFTRLPWPHMAPLALCLGSFSVTRC